VAPEQPEQAQIYRAEGFNPPPDGTTYMLTAVSDSKDMICVNVVTKECQRFTLAQLPFNYKFRDFAYVFLDHVKVFLFGGTSSTTGKCSNTFVFDFTTQ
jgi:hypothetical protein